MPKTVVMTEKGQKTGPKTIYWFQRDLNFKKWQKMAKIIVASSN